MFFCLFFLFVFLTFFLFVYGNIYSGTFWNCLKETILISTHNISICEEMKRKTCIWKQLLSSQSYDAFTFSSTALDRRGILIIFFLIYPQIICEAYKKLFRQVFLMSATAYVLLYTIDSRYLDSAYLE